MANLKNSSMTLSDDEKERPQTTSAKIIFTATWTILFCLAALMIVGIWSDILVDNRVFVPLLKVSLALSAVFVVYLIYVMFIGDTFARRNIERMQDKRGKKRKRRWTAVLGLFLLIPTLFILGIAKGLPFIGHYFTAHDAEMTLTIARKSSSYHQRYCSGRIEFKAYPYLFNDEVCGIQKADWETIQPGEKIVLIGKQSKYGFTVERYRLMEPPR